MLNAPPLQIQLGVVQLSSAARPRYNFHSSGFCSVPHSGSEMVPDTSRQLLRQNLEQELRFW